MKSEFKFLPLIRKFNTDCAIFVTIQLKGLTFLLERVLLLSDQVHDGASPGGHLEVGIKVEVVGRDGLNQGRQLGPGGVLGPSPDPDRRKGREGLQEL